MPYITTPLSPVYYQISIDDILDIKPVKYRHPVSNEGNTRTVYVRHINDERVKSVDVLKLIDIVEEFTKQNEHLFEADRQSLYKTFYIPKNSGGLRRIDAPEPELMKALRTLKEILERMMPASYHTSAFAYISDRCTVDAIKKHQQNKSKWFVKMDFSDFFGSTTENFVFKMFSQIFPFSSIVTIPSGERALRKALSLCFLNGGLPQGTPISPFITNVMMIPIDHQLCNKFKKFPASPDNTAAELSFVYTRYADDILISSKYNFDYKKIQEYVIYTLNKFEAPFSLNPKKTRYGSSSGSNWNLGLMLNKDNEITIGYKKKRLFKAMCVSYITSKLNNEPWSLEEVQHFAGNLSYYRMIEEDYINHVVDCIGKKFNTNIDMLIKNDLNHNRKISSSFNF